MTVFTEEKQDSLIKEQRSASHMQHGFAYIALLVAISIIGISLGAAGKYWQYIIQRDKEEELLSRGSQYQQAIERYYYALPPPRQQYPESIDQLLSDNRTAAGKRHLRHKYKDPMTGDDFVEIREQLSKRIIGVHSASDKQPLKQAEFPDALKDFAGKSKYSEWQFVFSKQSITAPPRSLPRGL